MSTIILKEEPHHIVGTCMEVRREPGMGFKEIIYKEALPIEFAHQNIPFEREKKFVMNTKGIF